MLRKVKVNLAGGGIEIFEPGEEYSIRAGALPPAMLESKSKRREPLTRIPFMKLNYRKVFTLLPLAVLGVLAGCVVTSVYPYYTSKDVVFDAALVGTWSELTETNTAEKNWRFEAGLEQSYKLTVREGDEKTVFTAHLFKLKGQQFLDALPVKKADDYIPPHYLLKVERIQPQLETRLMNYDWLKELVKQNPRAIRHLWLGVEPGKPGSGKLVLTADTAELQKFLLKYGADTNAFGDAITMKRQ